MKFQVTQEHINNGRPRDCSGCPVQMSLAEGLQEPRIKVDECFIYLKFFARESGRRIETPDSATDFIRGYDSDRMGLRPFIFEIPGTRDEILAQLK